MRIRYTGRAGADLKVIALYLGQRSPRAADQVVREIRHQIRTLSDIPLKGIATSVASARRLTISRYPYFIFYRLEGDSISVLHIRHTSRRPWRGGAD